MSDALKIMPHVVRHAAEWAALLDSDSIEPHQLAACEAWCGENELHRSTLERMRSVGARLDNLDETQRLALRRLDERDGTRRSPRRKSIAALCVLVCAGSLGGFLVQHRQDADYRTSPGERMTVVLADDSTLIIDSGSSVDTQLRDTTRTVTLLEGRLLATVAPDPQRPFEVRTADGTATALGTKFLVRHDDAGTSVVVVESRVRLCAHPSTPCVELGAGEQARIEGGHVSRAQLANVAKELTWTRGWLEVDDEPVVEVLREIARYHSRPLHFDVTALAGIRVTGSYPLEEPARALRAIADTTGLQVVNATDGSVTVSNPR
jgi:transmembrane sensor